MKKTFASISELKSLPMSKLEEQARERRIKPVDKLTLADDYLFGEVMHKKDVCAGVVERLLGIKAGKITYPEVQKSIKPLYESKGIRMDVLARDGKKLYNLEMQTSKFASLPLRMRYYQGLLDVDLLMSGHKYRELYQSYIIFICTKDPFGQKLPVYTFCNTCQENLSLKLNDKCMKIFYNVSAWQSDGNTERSSLLRYIKTGIATSSFTDRLDGVAQEIKNMNKFRREYMIQNMHFDDALYYAQKKGEARGVIRGAEKTMRQNILGLNRNKVPVSIIASSLGKTQAEVEEIIRSELDKASKKK